MRACLHMVSGFIILLIMNTVTLLPMMYRGAGHYESCHCKSRTRLQKIVWQSLYGQVGLTTQKVAEEFCMFKP